MNSAKRTSSLGFMAGFVVLEEWARQDSNLRPSDYESGALTN